MVIIDTLNTIARKKDMTIGKCSYNKIVEEIADRGSGV